MPADPIGVVKRELLVRQLDAWLPYALHRSRRATLALAHSGPDHGTVEAALRVVPDFADLLWGRRLAVLVLTGGILGGVPAGLPAELPPGVTVHPVAGGVDRLPVALRAAGAAGAPLLAYLDAGHGPAPAAVTLAALATGRPAEVLLALGGPARDGWRRPPGPDGTPHRELAAETGLALATEVELVADGTAAQAPGGSGERSELVAFATSAGRRLEAFKDAMWAVDEYAGVRYRDPGDPVGHLLDISLSPHPGPLRRELLARLAEVGAATVAELREFTMTRTVYRAADANRVLTALVAAGQLGREPPHGRLGGDVVVARAGADGDTA